MNIANIANSKLVEITQQNLDIFKNLAHAYEAEFSKITCKMPDEFGLFKIDTFPFTPYIGYLLYQREIPIGFCVTNVENEIKDIAEFYIAPVMRKNNFGYQLASMIFNKHPGQWQVRQIEGADHAVSFWRSVIKKYTKNQYEESVVQDPFWGIVTRQRFKTPENK